MISLDRTITIKIIIELWLIETIIIHLGAKPVKGGSPANDKSEIKKGICSLDVREKLVELKEVIFFCAQTTSKITTIKE